MNVQRALMRANAIFFWSGAHLAQARNPISVNSQIHVYIVRAQWTRNSLK